jgi:hypothetical protein
MKLISNFNLTFESFKKRIEIGFTVIPASIRYDKRMNDTIKILYGVLVMLNNTYDFVYASNEYLSKLLLLSKTSLRESLYKLKELKYIEVKDIDNDRYICVKKDDLINFKSKVNIDVSSLDYESLSNYYSLIPGYVLMSDSINPTEKILYAEIMSLTNKYGFAFISNDKLSDLMNLSNRQLIRCLNNLLKYNFIKYGKDIKSKRLIYVSYHFKKEFKAINKHYKFEVLENKDNDISIIKNVMKDTVLIDPGIEKTLDEIYKNIK